MTHKNGKSDLFGMLKTVDPFQELCFSKPKFKERWFRIMAISILHKQGFIRSENQLIYLLK